MVLIYQTDQTKLWELESGIPSLTGLEFAGDRNRISTEMPIQKSGTFYVQLVFKSLNITLEVTIHEKCSEREGLLGGQENYVYEQNFNHRYRYGIQLITKNLRRFTLAVPEEYSGLKLDSSTYDMGTQKFRFTSPEMNTPATDWGIINLCTFLLVQVPGFSLPEEKVLMIPQRQLAAVS